jgi:hypothetical protein
MLRRRLVKVPGMSILPNFILPTHKYKCYSQMIRFYKYISHNVSVFHLSKGKCGIMCNIKKQTVNTIFLITFIGLTFGLTMVCPINIAKSSNSNSVHENKNHSNV